MDFASIIRSFILFALIACKGEGDSWVRIHKDVAGNPIQIGQLVELTAVEKTEEGEVLWASTEDDRTALVTRGPSIFTNDLFAALGKLNEGDSATVKINLDSMVEKMDRIKPNTKGKYLVYELRIHKVVRNIDSFMLSRMQQLKAQESIRLAAFKERSTTASGLRYTVMQDGAGEQARAGDTVFVSYKATLLGGRGIDSAGNRPYIAGLNTTIAGLEEALQLFPAKTKVTLVIPSALAFGEAGYEGIQPYSPLVYDLEILRIGKFTGKRPNETGATLPDFHFTNIANDVLLQKDDVPAGPCVFIFFSTDCDHCQQLLSDLAKHPLTNKHVYLVSADSRQAIQQAVSRHRLPNVTVLHDDQKVFLSRFQATRVPSVYSYDTKHRLISVAGNLQPL